MSIVYPSAGLRKGIYLQSTTNIFRLTRYGLRLRETYDLPTFLPYTAYELVLSDAVHFSSLVFCRPVTSIR